MLVGSIGLVGLSLTAQSGGAVYTRAMSFGAGLGLGLYGLFALPASLTTGAFSGGALILNLILLAGLYWAWRVSRSFREELGETNRSGKILAWIAVIIVTIAAYFSILLLLY